MLTTKTIAAAFTAVAFTLGGTAVAMAFPATVVDNGKVHSNANKNSNIVGSIHFGQTVNVKKCVKNGNWCYVTKKGPDGWVRANKLDFDFDYYDEDFGYNDPGVKVCLGNWNGQICITD